MTKMANMLLIKSAFKLFLLTIIFLLATSCKKSEYPAPTVNDPRVSGFYFGADLSYVNQIEDKGGIFRENTIPVDPFTILAHSGVNLVRLRLWHYPEWVRDIYGPSTVLYSGLADVEKSIRRAKAEEMKVMLNFHYSDTWADPGNQQVPAAWQNITDINILSDSVFNYTYAVLKRLKSKNLLPEMVQIGNETNCGMMLTGGVAGFPDLNVCNGNWVNMGKVLNAGIDAVRRIDQEAGVNTKIILHVADPGYLDWWTRDIINRGNVTRFDIIGFSYYHIWHHAISFTGLSTHVKNIRTRYNKDVMVLETAYPFTAANSDNYPNIYFNQPPVPGFPYTVEGQKNFMIALNQQMIDAGALGVVYWEPAWITSNLIDKWGTGSSWDNCTFFNFSGNITNVVEYLKHPYNMP